MSKKKKTNDEVLGCVYLLRNLINGKGYVGQHKNVLTVEHRWDGHIKDALDKKYKRLLHYAIRKYGVKNFSAEVIWRGDRSLLDVRETYYIKKLHTFVYDPKGGGYNLTRGGSAPAWSERSKKKASKTHTIRWALVTVEERALINQRHRELALQQWASDEGRKKMVAALSSQETRQKISAVVGSPEARRWASKVAIKRFKDPAERQKLVDAFSLPEARQNRRNAQINRWRDLAEHQNASVKQLLRYEDPKERKKTKDALNRPEVKAKTSKASKAAWAKKTPEERSAIGVKARDTRRANALKKSKPK